MQGVVLPKCGMAEKLKWGKKVGLKLAISGNKKDRENSWNYWSLQPGKVWWACSLFPPSLLFYFPSLSCRWQFLTSLPLEGQRKKGVGWVREDSSYLMAAGAMMENTLTIPQAIQSRETGKIPGFSPPAPSSLCSTSHQPNPGRAQMIWEPRKLASQNQLSYIKFPYWCNRLPQT